MSDTPYDIFIIGGGINGCGIARDAAGRGLRVGLAEMNDLGSATSSASTKLFHGGLRYLEYLEIRLVRESLIERERLLRAMPHISWPMRFVLPYHREQRFESDTPVGRIVGFFMPWLKGRRPAWLIRLGLFLYDNLGGRKILPGTKSVDLRVDPVGEALKETYRRAFEYSDCWVQDARLVVLNARDAQVRGADIQTRTRVVSARVENGIWQIELDNGQTVQSRCLINAAGPWVSDVIQGVVSLNTAESIRLVRGSHIVTPKLYDHDKCYFFQGRDGRIIFAIPYEQEFTLIGTTDAEHSDAAQNPECTPQERDYLIDFANEYFEKSIGADDVVWTYSGVRPLYDDGADNASAATRDYVLTLDKSLGAPVLNIFGGKITTYRKLAEHALEKIATELSMDGAWTAGVTLPGGDFEVSQTNALVDGLVRDYAFLTPAWAQRLIRTYGTEARVFLGDAQTVDDLGQRFGATLYAREVQWLIDQEYAQTAEDILWRRTKLGLRLDDGQVADLNAWIAAR